MLAAIDLDGTLLRTDGSLDPADLRALRELGRRGVVRVIATGRSLYSYRRAMRRALSGGDLPVDYLVFSSGAATLCSSDGAFRDIAELTAEETTAAAEVLGSAGLDFMVHDLVPENHRFAYRATGGENPDFLRRIGLYPDHCRPLPDDEVLGPATQLLAVIPSPDAHKVADRITPELPGFSVIRATSPIDGASLWLEVFPAGVSKGTAVARLAGEHGLGAERVLAVGNDYNDEDLLAWAGTAFVVANAPADLRGRYPAVPGCDERGVATAVERWLSAAGPAAEGPITSRRS